MNKQELLCCIENMLLSKDVGEHHLHELQSKNTVYPITYDKAKQRGLIHYFVAGNKTIDHRLYEIFIGDNNTVILSTYSYTIPVTELSHAELMVLYEEMKPYCTYHGEPICE